MMEMICVNTTVIDSDCAVLDLYDGTGKKPTPLLWYVQKIMKTLAFCVSKKWCKKESKFKISISAGLRRSAETIGIQESKR